MSRIRKRLLFLTCAALAAALFLLILIPAFAVGGDYGIHTGSTPGGPTPHLSVYPNTATPEPTAAPTATPTP